MADTTINAGRGVLFIGLAKLYFMFAGWAIYFVLPRILGSEVVWGNYLLVTGWVSVIDNVIVAGTIQAISRFTAQGHVEPDAVKKAGLKLMSALGITISLAYFLIAPWLAEWERDRSLAPLFRISAGIIVCYALYSVFVGSINGKREFGRQASLDAGFATIRAALILVCATYYGIHGALAGWVTAALTIVAVSAIWVGVPRKTAQFPIRRIISFTLQLFAYTLAINLVMRADLFLIKRFVTEIVGEVGSARQTSSAIVGLYGTAQVLAFIPYQAVLAIAFVIFPLVSRTTFENDLETTRNYIRQTLRLSTIFVAGLAAVMMANPGDLITVIYPESYRAAGSALRILSAGLVCFCIFIIANTILNGSGRTRLPLLVSAITLVAVLTSNSLMLRTLNNPIAALQTAAWATTASMALGATIAAALLYRVFGASLPLVCVFRCAAAMGAVIMLGKVIPNASKLMTIAESVVLLAVYVLVVALVGEFSSSDRRKVIKVFQRNKP